MLEAETKAKADDEAEAAAKILASRPVWPRRSARDGTGSPGQRIWLGRVGSRVSVSDPVFDPVLSFNMRVFHGVVSAA